MGEILIDINCDVGEGVKNEPLLFPYISSCNIACGGHAGDRKSMLSTVKLAKTHEVNIGAHPSYPDKANFGRVSMKIGAERLLESIKGQISLLERICKEESVCMSHIKPHGALYNDLAKEESLAELFLDAIYDYRDQLALFVPYGSVIEKLAHKKGFKVMVEAFADRNYTNDLNLVSRSNNNALITEPEQVLKHIMYMVRENKVCTISGEFKPMHADTYCIHGDTVKALEILTYINKELPNHNIVLKR